MPITSDKMPVLSKSLKKCFTYVLQNDGIEGSGKFSLSSEMIEEFASMVDDSAHICAVEFRSWEQCTLRLNLLQLMVHSLIVRVSLILRVRFTRQQNMAYASKLFEEGRRSTCEVTMLESLRNIAYSFPASFVNYITTFFFQF